MRNLLFTLGVGAGFFFALYQWITMLAECTDGTDGQRVFSRFERAVQRVVLCA